MTREERRAAFERRAREGKERNHACLRDAGYFEKRVESGKMTLRDALCLAWAEGEAYGRKRFAPEGVKEKYEEMLAFVKSHTGKQPLSIRDMEECAENETAYSLVYGALEDIEDEYVAACNAGEEYDIADAFYCVAMNFYEVGKIMAKYETK